MSKPPRRRPGPAPRRPARPLKHHAARTRARKGAGRRKAGARTRHYTKAQQKSFRKWAAAHPLPQTYRQYLRSHPNRAKRTAGKAGTKPPSPKARKPKTRTRKTRGAAAPVLPGVWVTGRNDEMATCAAVAVANSLLIATGMRVGDGDVASLHWRSGGPCGARVTAVLREARRGGIGGRRPSRVSAARRLVPGVVCGAGVHAFTVSPDGRAVSWGGELPLPAVIDEAWTVEWDKAG